MRSLAIERERVWTSEVGSHVGERVTLAGWLHRFRPLSNVAFLILRDAKGLAQVVVEEQALRAQLDGLYNESVLRVTGTVVAVPQVPDGVEIHDPSVEILSAAAAPPPFDLFRPVLQPPLATLLDHQPLMLRHPRQRALFQLSAAAMAGFRATLSSLDFVEIQTPKIVGSATEGGANVFKIDYLGRPAYLSQSPQLYKQLMVGVFERVFEVGPAFRAEPHDTPRHLNEFVSLDAELGFIHDHRDVMAVLTHTLRGMLDALRTDAAGALALLGLADKLPVVLAAPAEIPVVTFTDALALIARGTGEDLAGEPDLAPAHERWLGEWARREHGSDFLFVTGYPAATKPFYTHPDPANPAFTNAFDLLFRGVELVSGGQRLHRYEDYCRVLAERHMNEDAFTDFLEAFRHGMPPHGGFAIGLERFIARLVEAPNVRETTLFPRDLHRLTP
ncbi:MAG: Aspartyl-tRNA synthetase @ Aspartyl-tRNA(Asn) synthetase [uncultured Chloroflexi bacterium]|uniref:Aspartate--tRNA(Asp/Asn) ligase n=1 Tax=uncultured Chloroflexota bacterium TaxID=166587 RepID=A0A6J4J3U9_9CHLR|nr:MAG: Aspartyl-tRNA synthetase @ Aspartyl-tRNA(Asn) synthetase [uncultured Chloroflexota bacterium]